MTFCDSCGELTNCTLISREEFQNAVRDGFNPFKTGQGDITGQAGIHAAWGVNVESTISQWKNSVMADKTAWGLCSDCLKVFRDETGRRRLMQTSTRGTETISEVIRDDSIDCPHCSNRLSVTYEEDQALAAATCSLCSVRFRVMEVPPKTTMRESYWGFEGARTCSRWLYVAWRQSILSLQKDFLEYILEHVDLRCSSCQKSIAFIGTAHIVQSSSSLPPRRATQMVARSRAVLVCKSCFDQRRRNNWEPWDGDIGQLRSSFFDMPFDESRETFADMSAFRRTLPYVPYAVSDLSDLDVELCPYCRHSNRPPDSDHQCLSACEWCGEQIVFCARKQETGQASDAVQALVSTEQRAIYAKPGKVADEVFVDPRKIKAITLVTPGGISQSKRNRREVVLETFLEANAVQDFSRFDASLPDDCAAELNAQCAQSVFAMCNRDTTNSFLIQFAAHPALQRTHSALVTVVQDGESRVQFVQRRIIVELAVNPKLTHSECLRRLLNRRLWHRWKGCPNCGNTNKATNNRCDICTCRWSIGLTRTAALLLALVFTPIALPCIAVVVFGLVQLDTEPPRDADLMVIGSMQIVLIAVVAGGMAAIGIGALTNLFGRRQVVELGLRGRSFFSFNIQRLSLLKVREKVETHALFEAIGSFDYAADTRSSSYDPAIREWKQLLDSQDEIARKVSKLREAYEKLRGVHRVSIDDTDEVVLPVSQVEQPLAQLDVPSTQQFLAETQSQRTVAEVCRITAKHFGVEVFEVEPSTSLRNLNANELDVLELIVKLERHFDVSISDKAIARATNDDHWQRSDGKVTMSNLAEVVDQQNR
jgi:acyl carrier protein